MSEADRRQLTPEQRARVDEILAELMQLPDAERERRAAGLRGEDPGVRREVLSLLGEVDSRSTVLFRDAGPAVDALRTDAPPAAMASAEPLPGRIAGFHIKQLLGSGGMGAVYLAVQEKPRRTVALKVMQRGIASRSTLRRFEYESQILARLRHPNIAQVYEAGTHDDGTGGVPYFALEYVPNARTLIEYANATKLETPQRLRLFVRVCDAVHHGHQKGVIHRDLKPGNILVDSAGEPKIIDFGVARATDSDMTVTTLQTDVGQLIGTLQYMSPEQCDADPHDIDTRSDVYALGVVLYELLCGQLPYEVKSAAIYEAARIIREEEPPKPSTRVRSMEDESSASAKQRRVDPKTLVRTLRGDLDWIVMKALEKNRERRYETASGLAMDIRRHLLDEPVVAGPPSATYRLGKFVRRHRAGVLAGTLVAAALLVSTVVSIGFAVSEAEQRRRADEEREIAQAVNEFLNNDLLAAVAPSAQAGKGRSVLMRDVLDEAAQRIDDASGGGGKFEDKPLVEASIRATLGETYRLLGEYTAAEPHLERAERLHRRELGKEHPDTLVSMNELALLYSNQGRYDEAEPLYLEALELKKRVLGEEDRSTLKSMNSLAALYRKQGRYDDAERLHLETLEIRKRVLGEEDPDTLTSMNNLAVLYKSQRRHDEAESLYLETLEICKRVQGQEHPDTLTSMNNLASLYVGQGRYDEAERLHLETLEIKSRVQGEEHPSTLMSMSNLAILYKTQARYDEAEPLYLETLEIRKRVLGEEHPDTLVSMNNLAALYWKQDRYDDMESLCLETLEIKMRVLRAGHPSTLVSMRGLALLYQKQRRYDEAERLYLDILEAVGQNHERRVGPIRWLIDLYTAWGKPDKAAEWREKLPPDA